MNKQTILLAGLAFVAPLAVMVIMQRDALTKPIEIEPHRGKLLYFTSPS